MSGKDLGNDTMEVVSISTWDAIVSWVKKKTGPGIYDLSTVEEAERILIAEPKVVLGFLDSLVLEQDCLELLNNLIRSNTSNQVLLRETIGIDPLISIVKLRGSSYSFNQQKTINLLSASETIGLLIMGGPEIDTGKDANRLTSKVVLVQLPNRTRKHPGRRRVCLTLQMTSSAVDTRCHAPSRALRHLHALRRAATHALFHAFTRALSTLPTCAPGAETRVEPLSEPSHAVFCAGLAGLTAVIQEACDLPTRSFNSDSAEKEALRCIGDLIANHTKNLDALASKVLREEPQVEPALNSILRIILRTCSMLEFVAADYVFKCFCEKNPDGQAMLASTLIPQPQPMTHAPPEEDVNMSFGSILLHGLTLSQNDGDLE
ncbi:unnamed protein product [Camellia sinensis]